MKIIEYLTAEQKAKLPQYRDEWIRIGLTEEKEGFNRTLSERAICSAYTCASLPKPKTFIWVESPLHAGVCFALLRSTGASVRASVYDSVRASVRASVYDSVRASVSDSVRDSVRASVRDSVSASVRDSVSASVRASVYDSVRASVSDSVRDSVSDSVSASVSASVYGSQEAYWLSFYKFFQEECDIDCSKLSGLFEVAYSSGWFAPFRGTVIVSPRPYTIKTRINERNNHELHADGSPAVYYCDDFKIYANCGVRLPEKYGAVRTTDWQSKWLIEEKNAELRMCLIKNIGYEKMFHELEAKKLDTWREYELLRIENVDVEPVHLLKMTCPSTNRIHIGRVPPDCLFAREAAKLRNEGIDPEEFIIER